MRRKNTGICTGGMILIWRTILPAPGRTGRGHAQLNELRNYANIPSEGPLDDETSRTLVHGYYACVSYVDAQIGRVLDELEHLGLKDNTIVVIWGDHGWQLGEHGLWCKHCNFENALHSPLIIRAPASMAVSQMPLWNLWIFSPPLPSCAVFLFRNICRVRALYR